MTNPHDSFDLIDGETGTPYKTRISTIAKEQLELVPGKGVYFSSGITLCPKDTTIPTATALHQLANAVALYEQWEHDQKHYTTIKPGDVFYLKTEGPFEARPVDGQPGMIRWYDDEDSFTHNQEWFVTRLDLLSIIGNKNNPIKRTESPAPVIPE